MSVRTPCCPSRLGMELNVSQLLMEPSGSGRRYDIDEPVRLLDGAAMSRIHGSVKLLRTNKSVWVSAALDSELDSECGRCLAPYSQPIHLQVEEEYVPTHDPASGWRVEPPPGDADYYLIDENHILNLAEAVREYAVMALPIKAPLRPRMRRSMSHLWRRPQPRPMPLRNPQGRPMGPASRTHPGITPKPGTHRNEKPICRRFQRKNTPKSERVEDPRTTRTSPSPSPGAPIARPPACPIGFAPVAATTTDAKSSPRIRSRSSPIR